MIGTGVKQSPEPPDQPLLDPLQMDERELAAAHARQAERLRLLWNRRRKLFLAGVFGLLVSTLIAFVIPKSYTSTAQLMPPDQQSSNGLAMMAALAGKTLGGLAGVSGDLLGMRSSGALFVGVLRSETSENRIVQQFDLQKVYGARLLVDARRKLDDNTVISEDRKSGIITIKVTDHDPQRAAAIANAYIDELNALVAQLSTSAAHRERVFLEDRLKVAKVDLDNAANQLAQFSSKNNTLDIQIEGKAMLDAAGALAGQLIAAESELQGLREIYTDNNARVRALSARVADLRKELQKFGGVNQEPKGNGSTPSDTSLLTGDPSSDKSALSAFPTIRNLPLLGAKYSEYYRRTKIEETVFELLTEQYEMAKVQEAKETPSVKVLDPGSVPERKSFPPRSLIVFLGTFLALILTAIWIVATKGWADVDPQDPRKVLAVEMATTMFAYGPWGERNGDATHSWAQKIWTRIKSQNQPTNGVSDE
jgi:capsule polysaccharide export protein KpsE/RkpR